MSFEEEIYICCDCVGEKYLGNLVSKSGIVVQCHYCGQQERSILIEELADEVESAFSRHYYRTSPDPDSFEVMLLKDKEIDYEWDRHGEPALYAIANAADVHENIAQDILDILEERNADFDSAAMGEECEFGGDSHYEWSGANDQEFQFAWQEVEASIQTRSRFFNDDATGFLDKIFADLDNKFTVQGDKVIVRAGPSHELKSFMRGRVFHSDDDLIAAMERPDIFLGPPPSKLARAGRMNANGISVFYGAMHKDVAIAEIRPPVGSRVLLGQFKLLRDIRLLNLPALQSLLVEGSIFDPEYLDQLQRAKFLESFVERLTMPVMPNDEPSEYLITQMLADYLVRSGDEKLDGVLYPSVQSVGSQMNVAIFNHSALVEPLDLPDQATLDGRTYQSTEDGPEPDYLVWENVPPEEKEEEETEDINDLSLAWASDPVRFDPWSESREPTLEIDLETLEVHHISAAQFTTDPYSVRRHRMVNREWPF